MSRFLISNLREGPEEFRRQLPISGETIEIRLGPDGQTYFSARLDEQIMHRLDPSADTAALPAERVGADDFGPFLWVSDIVMRPSRPGDSPHYGMQRFPVDVAYVLDLSYLDDQTVDFTKLHPVAAIDIDDLPEDAEPIHQDDQLSVPPPPAPTNLTEDPADDDSPTTDGTPVELAADDLPADPAAPTVADDHEITDNHEITDDHSAPAADPDRVPGASRPSDDGATPPDTAPVIPAAAAEPSPLATQTEPAPVLDEPAADDTHRHTDVLPDPEPGAAGAVHDEQSGAAAPRNGEDTGPVRTATTARPPASPTAGADTAAKAPRRPFDAPPAPPAPRAPFGATLTAPPTRPPHNGGPPVLTSTWPEGARSPHPGTARQTPPWNGALPPPIIPTTPSRRAPSAKALTIGAVVLTGVVLVGVAVWNVAGSDSGTDQAPTTTQARPTAEDVQRLNDALPKGYSETSCTTDETSANASVTCGPNTDPGGPTTATYTLYPDQQALAQAFTDTIATYTRVTCPGNIQSPGPWRRNAAPDVVAGTLFCGTQSGQAVVAWTSDAESLLNVAEAGAQGPSMDQLYTWWGTHS
ncbi:hypothetical protein H7I77_04745 [Mycolicibacterium novocastrense]|uniref:Serine/threonine protein kinase n=1 Tax=Mycolicibacterium novocastrense TaxID=59813 RepID=A0AAW5SHE1_MYCNV|nr:hypothetical protein [Mycolicibacterium novocastrense]MCV7022659.1 hypothetical protein [Mycolicibacterium novocastrense]